MSCQSTGLFQGLAPLLDNRTIILTLAKTQGGLVTLNVIPKKVSDDESDALTTALCITAAAEELDRDLPAQLREYTTAHAQAASNIQKVKADLAAAENAEREAADEKRAKKAKGKVVPPAAPAPAPQGSLGLFDQTADDPVPSSAAQQLQAENSQSDDYPD